MNIKRVLCVASAVALGATAFAACGDSQEAASGPVPVIIDTDVGADDALALMAVLQDPGVDVRAITVTGTGLARCGSGVAIAAGLVELTGHPQIPIACGSERPTSGNRAFPDEWRDQVDRRYGGVLPAADPPAESRPAVQLLTDVLTASDRDVTILTLGPFTTIAEAFADRSLVGHVERIVAMAGAVRVGGNVMLENQPGAARTEWNVYVDPAAAQAVLDSGVSMTLVPIDSQVGVDAYVLRAATAGQAPAAVKAARLLLSDPFYVSGSFFLWDPLAASALTQPAYLQHRTAKLAVSLTGAEAGRTVEGSGAEVDIATVSDADAFLASFLGLLDRTTPIALARQPTLSIDASAGAGCSTSTSTLHAGPAVIELSRPMTAVAVGSMVGERSDEEIDAYVASQQTSAPDWFPLLRMFQALDEPSAAYMNLPIGTYDALCFAVDADEVAHITGRTVLTIS